MTSAPIRDAGADHLITPQNSALIVIDYQPSQLAAVRSMDHDLLVTKTSSLDGKSGEAIRRSGGSSHC